MHRETWALLAIFAATSTGGVLAACGATSDDTGTTNGGTGASTGTGGGGTGAMGQGGVTLTGTGGQGQNCSGGPDDDVDKDGYTISDGDCDDCNENINPGAVEVIAEADENGNTPDPADEDCDGTIDNVPPPCDSGLAIDDPDPADAAKAVGICNFVKTAEWVLADGSPPPGGATQNAAFHMGHGILPDLGGSNPAQEGERMLMLSSGTARRPSDPGFIHRNYDKSYTGNPPFGFPKDSPSCPGIVTNTPHDAAGLEVVVNAPTNLKGFSFDFHFFTYEWPQYICTEFNDFFVANLDPIPKMQQDGNISFDKQGNPISVNNAFLDGCACPAGPPCLAPPSAANKKSFDCALGNAPLQGTDYDDDDGTPVGWSNGSTGWLRTKATVEPGKAFTIRFTVYDSSDGMVDSSVLVDNWQWSGVPGSGTDIAK